MAGNVYALESEWQMTGCIQEVYDIISDADGLADWWPSGFLSVDVTKRGDDVGLGKELQVVTKGWLPYTIRWSQLVTEIDPPNGFTIEVRGDFDGRGVWTLVQDGDAVIVRFDWRINADKPLLRYGSPVLKPIFTWNHRWIMARGRESLALEILRRRAVSAEDRMTVPLPPGPTWPHRRRSAPARAVS